MICQRLRTCSDASLAMLIPEWSAWLSEEKAEEKKFQEFFASIIFFFSGIVGLAPLSSSTRGAAAAADQHRNPKLLPLEPHQNEMIRHAHVCSRRISPVHKFGNLCSATVDVATRYK